MSLFCFPGAWDACLVFVSSDAVIAVKVWLTEASCNSNRLPKKKGLKPTKRIQAFSAFRVDVSNASSYAFSFRS